MNILYLYTESAPDTLTAEILKNIDEVELLEDVTSPVEALAKIKKEKPDAILIDSDYPGFDGISFAYDVAARSPRTALIYISKDSAFAVDAFRVNALDFLLKPVTRERLEMTIEKLKKYIQTQENEKTSQKAEISVFGMFTVMVGDDIVRWQTLKGAEIFAYLLFNNKKTGIEKWKIINSIWGNVSESKADVAFRSYLHRLNQTLKTYNTGITVKSLQGAYKLEYQNIEVDAYKLEEYAKNALPIEESEIQPMQDLIFSYDGEIFGGFDFKWRGPVMETINLNFEQLCKKLCRYFISAKKYVEADRVVSHYLKVNKFDEEAFEIKLDIKHLMGKTLEAERYYNELCELYQSQLGSEPNKRLKKYLK